MNGDWKPAYLNAGGIHLLLSAVCETGCNYLVTLKIWRGLTRFLEGTELDSAKKP